MKNVLVAVDGSASAHRALAWAVRELEGRADATLHLLNVQAPLLHPWPGKLVSPDLIDAVLRAAGEQILTDSRKEWSADISVFQHVSIGFPSHEITACAVEHGCEVIVMGTRGMGVVAGLVMGSVAQKIVHLAAIPIVLVK